MDPTKDKRRPGCISTESGMLAQICLLSENFPGKLKVVRINMPVSFNSWKGSFWVLTQQGTIGTGRRSDWHADTLL